MRVMIGGVFFVIFILWAFNLKNVWQANRRESVSSSEWLNLKQELTKTLDEVQSKLDQIKTEQAAADQRAGDKLASGILAGAAKQTASSSGAYLATSSSIIATSTANQKSSASSSASAILDNYCPEYIDCMPTVGAAKPCIVPLGCEGITLIAY